MSISKELKQGALVNFFGVVGKMAAPAFLIVVNRLFGPDVFGIYITANISIEIIIAFLTSGFKDGALIFVSRHADDTEEQTALYTALTNSFAWAIGLSIIVLIGSILFGNQIIEYFYKDEFSDGLMIMFQFMMLSIPLMAFERIVLAATQGLKIMKYDALNNGWFRPIALLGFSILFWFFEPSLTGMALAYLSTQSLLFLVSVFIYNRELSWKKLFLSFRRFTINRELIEFAIPQNINMTLNRFITGIDILMLPFFGFSPATVGFYGAGSMIIREIRSVKLIFSTAFAPHIVRMHKEQKFAELSNIFSKTAAWIATIAIPVILTIAIFKDTLLILIHPEYTENTAFMYYLLPIPYLYCSFSLAGNIVAMTGHSKLSLMNSLIVASTNIILNLILIPRMGIVGAALASSVAMFILISFELAEARIVASTKLYLKDILRPHLAGFLALTFFVLGLNLYPESVSTFTGQILLSLPVLITFLIVVGKKYLLKVKPRIA